MTTPQDPGGDPPQDPQDPQNPYGAPPPPPPNVPPPVDPAPPVTPPATAIPPAPQAPPAYGTTFGATPTPPYGDPSTAAPPAPPAYGQPTFPAYGAPQQPSEPGKGMAIAALISSILGCTCIGALVAIPLAIVVLVRSRDGRNHGKGLAIAALIISTISLIGLSVGGYALYDYAKDLKSPNDLRAGDCITASGLTDENADSVTEIRTVSCSSKHDGEVLATVELTADQAENYTSTPFAEFCSPAIDAAGKTDVISDTVTYTALSNVDPSEGDQAACVAYHVDGSKLTGKLGS
jgi:hypothetical protein